MEYNSRVGAGVIAASGRDREPANREAREEQPYRIASASSRVEWQRRLSSLACAGVLKPGYELGHREIVLGGDTVDWLVVSEGRDRRVEP
jgi:hypothetical protein